MTITLNDRTAVYDDIAEILRNAGYSDDVVDVYKIVEEGYVDNGGAFTRITDDEFVNVVKNSAWGTMEATASVENYPDEVLYAVEVQNPLSHVYDLFTEASVDSNDQIHHDLLARLDDYGYVLEDVEGEFDQPSVENYVVHFTVAVDSPLPVTTAHLTQTSRG